MSDKRSQIIEAAIHCFASKGFHAATMQDIADTAGIAKGSLYFYFESKEALLHSTLGYYQERNVSTLHRILNDKSLSPREKLFLQIEEQFRQVLEQREFITMLMSEQGVQINEEMKQFITAMRGEALCRFRENLLQMYGDRAVSYVLDGAALLIGLFNEYMGYMVLDRLEFNNREAAVFLVNRTEEAMEGMLAKKQKPLLTESKVHHLLQAGRPAAASALPPMLQEIRKMLSAAGTWSLEAPKREEAVAALLLLEKEAAKDQPEPLIMRGLIALLRGYKIADLKKGLSALEEGIGGN
ncbi:TetR/AcrR family transcriptional regulator [Paenibacillus gansuensis]|uniref:TetR/AcrR family transcriptional regulator n=1 Tax=Paenibacillus gansuensis TaxID=306542 RepID=A0ABW5PK06_9BACL